MSQIGGREWRGGARLKGRGRVSTFDGDRMAGGWENHMDGNLLTFLVVNVATKLGRLRVKHGFIFEAKFGISADVVRDLRWQSS